MPRVGRNDPCPCGSGSKYKKCCLDKDLENKITHIAPSPENDYSPQVQPSKGNEEFKWNFYLYEKIAQYIAAHMEGRYQPEQIAFGISLWNTYANEMEPMINKVAVFPATIEYFVAQINGMPITQKELASIYHVSAGTISKRLNEMLESGLFDEYLEDDYLESFIDSDELLNQSTEQVKSSKDHSNKHLAQDILFSAWDEPSSEKKIVMVQKALKLYPNSPDAYNILAEASAGYDLKEKIKYYKQGMLAGEADLGLAFFKKNKGHFWGMTETRPFMRSKSGYAECLNALGETMKAVKQYEEILDLNPMDNLGVRYLLTTLYIELENYRKASKLLNKYEESDAYAHYSRILIEYGMNGITDKLEFLWKKALNQNRYVIDYLIGKKRIPAAVPEYYSFGDKNEAAAYIYENINSWKQHPQLIHWLRNQ